MLSDEDYKYKIINASPSRLVIVTYEIILDRIKKAESSLSQGDEKNFRQNVNNAMQFVNELICSLDMSKNISEKMSALYFSVNGFLAAALSKKSAAFLTESANIISSLKKELEKEVDDGFGNIKGGADISGNYGKNRFTP